jgi:hypothetical protein
MRRAVVCLVAMVCTVLNADPRVSGFYAKRDHNVVILEWSTQNEIGIKSFQIERSSDGTHWYNVDTVPTMGSSSQKNQYSYRDQNIFKTSLNTLYYRLILVTDTGNIVHDVIASVEGNSGIRHTWGSIKAMFR